MSEVEKFIEKMQESVDDLSERAEGGPLSRAEMIEAVVLAALKFAYEAGYKQCKKDEGWY